ncbi:MAG: DegT/DnrJ/EryC1/StrS family aminotransferase [Thermodesulfobacteriota bacterium]
MLISMVNLKVQYEIIKDEIDRAIKEVLEDGNFILGPSVEKLEKEIASYLGVKYAVGLASGTDALHLALLACGVRKGHDVITTPFTFVSTVETIVSVGATPIFVDIDPRTYNIAPEKIKEFIDKKTSFNEKEKILINKENGNQIRAILPVHLYGQSADMEHIVNLCSKYNLVLIEDCAQAFGSEYKGRKVGTFGEIGCLSFFPSKNLGCYGDGGMIITDSQDLADKIRILRNHGSKMKYYYLEMGFNSRLDEIQSAILRVKLGKINKFNELRRKNASLYNDYLREVDIITPYEDRDVKHVYHQYTIRTRYRDKLTKYLRDEGIASAVYYPLPLHQQPVFKSLGFNADDLRNSESASLEVLSLPMYPELTEEHIQIVCKTIKNAMSTTIG